jgi:hypothetical protein
MGAAGIVAIVLLTALLLVRKPSPPSGLENGDFANDCCGSLTLREGQIILNGKSATSYTIGHDADGFYILPRNYVGGFDEIGFEIDGSRPAVGLRLDRISHIAYRIRQACSSRVAARRTDSSDGCPSALQLHLFFTN